MKLACIYWTLLLISVTSSCLLFLIVASETTHGSARKGIAREKVINNVTVGETGKSDGGAIPKISDHGINKESSERSPEISEESQEGAYSCTDSDSTDGAQDDENLSQNVFKESLTQQPNLSQGISETGQAVVLTLVDTASAELQNLAEPHLSSDIRSRPTNNLTLPTSRPLETSTSTLSSSPPSIPTVHLLTEKLNETDLKSPEDSPEKVPNDPNVVPTVRTEHKSSQDSQSESPDSSANEEVAKIPDDQIKPEDTQIPSSGDLDESAARVKVVSGSSEEAAAVIFDGLVGSAGSEHHEDIPSFSEWAQKRLEEAEKKKTHPNASIQNPGAPGKSVGSMKVRSKNYASPDCGAKVVAVNPEARSARSVLVLTRDEYMLNTCTSRVWFVVELCEAIQAKKVELANFELFSSSPKDFSVFVSDRFPTRDWSPVGQFTAQDERDIQSFTLHPHLFGKFIKVELHSHYGSEHFCPISLFRAYGTSEFEVLETETEVQETSDSDDDDDDEEVFEHEGNDSSRNLFGSARDAVINIVKKAAEVLVKTSHLNKNNITKIQESIEDEIQSSFASCMTPRYIIDCNNCTDDRFAKVFQLLSCRAHHLDAILKLDFVNHTLNQGKLCEFYGVEIQNSAKRKIIKEKSSINNSTQPTFMASVFSPEYVVALCNVLAAKDRRLVLNTSYEAPGIVVNSSSSIDIHPSKSEVMESASAQVTATCFPDSDSADCRSIIDSKDTKRRSTDSLIKEESSTVGLKDSGKLNSAENIATTETIASQIKPSKTLSKDDLKRESSVPNLEPSKDATDESIQAEVLTTPSPLINPATPTPRFLEESTILGTSTETTTHTVPLQSYSQVTIENLDSSTADRNIKYEAASGQKSDPGPNKQDDKDEKLKEPEDIISQDQINLDTLFSDLKELESDPMIPGSPNSASTVTQPAASSSPQQKESVFLRLSNRIKALERNMSLSGQYLEELSKRYKKQVEEMQRSLERTTTTMGEEFKKGEERELKRLEEISALREEITVLSESMEILLYDQNSWGSKLSTFGQHIVFILVEIVVLVLIIAYCRRSSDLGDDIPKTKVSLSKGMTRRKSAESMVTDQSKKTKKRRPSEIASKISGSYRGLMIDERSESRKERKRKRKKDSLMRLTSAIETRREISETILPSRRSLSMDCPNYRKIEDISPHKRPDSGPDCDFYWPQNLIVGRGSRVNGDLPEPIVIDEIDDSNSQDLITDSLIHRFNINPKDFVDTDVSRSGSPRGLSILKNARLHSPSFMKTALRSRSKRSEKSTSSDSPPGNLKSDNWECHSRYSESSRSDQESPANLDISLDSSINTTQNGSNGHHGVSDGSGSGSTTPTPGKKNKKDSGFRKMVRKFF